MVNLWLAEEQQSWINFCEGIVRLRVARSAKETKDVLLSREGPWLTKNKEF